MILTVTVDLGGSLAVASRGLFATGVSTDLNVTYLSSGGKVGDLIHAEVTCDKCSFTSDCAPPAPSLIHLQSARLLRTHQSNFQTTRVKYLPEVVTQSTWRLRGKIQTTLLKNCRQRKKRENHRDSSDDVDHNVH